MTPCTEASLRRAFKRFNPLMVGLWRLGLGQFVNFWPAGGGQIMVLVHTGRRSHQRRFTPVNYAIVNGDIYCTAGFGRACDWYRNLAADPNVEVWLPEGWWAGTAVDVTTSEARLALLRQVLIGSGAAARLAGIDPLTMTDAQLEIATAGYALIKIRRTEARTGPGGPGELAWVWPVMTLALCLAWSRRIVRRAGHRG